MSDAAGEAHAWNFWDFICEHEPVEAYRRLHATELIDLIDYWWRLMPNMKLAATREFPEARNGEHKAALQRAAMNTVKARSLRIIETLHYAAVERGVEGKRIETADLILRKRLPSMFRPGDPMLDLSMIPPAEGFLKLKFPPGQKPDAVERHHYEDGLAELTKLRSKLELEIARPTSARPGPPPPAQHVEARPSWDPDKGELWFGHRRLLRLSRQATNLRKVLDVLREDDWPHLTTSPLKNADQLRNARRDLNRKLPNDPPIIFWMGGDGESIGWRTP